MRTSALLKGFFLLVVSFTIVCAAEPAFAQRYVGGGRFSGGFHGGTTFSRGFTGARGGFYGGYPWRGGWGYPRYGYGWGFGLGFGIGWGSYWGVYPYSYYGFYYPYYPAYYYPSYPYPYYSWHFISDSDSYSEGPPVTPSSAPPPKSSPDWNSPAGNAAASTPAIPRYSSGTRTAQAAAYQQVESGLRQLSPDRRQVVENSISALRAMPPDARTRQIASGRFKSFSTEELRLLKVGSQVPAE